jgi:hypothetical protein
MYFCDKCFYIFDITKSSKVSKEDNRKSIAKVSDVFVKLDENEDFTKYKADFSKEELYKNKKYQKLDETEKTKINLLFEEMISSGAEFKCENCNYTKQITETTILYQINMEDKVEQIKNLEENELTTKDPTLPHTHDYTCKNPNCMTHKKPELKDAVFLREKNSYKLNYICCVCYYNW